MTLQLEFEGALRDAERARLRRVFALRAMLVEGESQRESAARLGVTQPAISYQIARERTEGIKPSELVAAGGPVPRLIAEQRGFTRLAVFGSVARGDDRPDSAIDFLVQPPAGADMADLARLEDDFSSIAGRSVDIVSYRGLDPVRDQDIIRECVEI